MGGRCSVGVVEQPAASVVVRLARPADADAVVRVVRAAYAPYLRRMDRPPAPLSSDYETLVSALAVRVLLADDRIVGVLVTWPHPDHLFIDNIAVDPAEQGTGVGSALLEDAEGEARALGLTRLRLYTNEVMTEALAFYARGGFVETHRAVEHGFRRVHFERLLAPLR